VVGVIRTLAFGVPGYCASCEDYSEELVRTESGERALCPSCYERSDARPITYADLQAFRCDCRRDEIVVIGSLEEQVGLCAGCIHAGKRSARIELDAPTDPSEFTARQPASHGDLDA
jgi:hypothetical protein